MISKKTSEYDNIEMNYNIYLYVMEKLFYMMNSQDFNST